MKPTHESQKPRRRPPGLIRRMRTCLIAGWLAAVPAGCAVAPRSKVEYIPSDRAVSPLKKGQPAPTDGWFVPPAVMQEVVPWLDEKYRDAPPDKTAVKQ